MRKLCSVLLVLTLSFATQAALQLVENFETIGAGNIDGKACTGVMGGTWDTESENTGNVVVETNSGSQVVRFMTTTAGAERGVGFNGLTDTIDTTETGTLFFRFMIRSDAQTPRSYLGLIADTIANPLSNTTNNNPWNYIAAGFAALDNGAGGYDIKTTNGATTLKAGLVRAQWYNVWIVANNVADTFDLYMSTATGPAIGAPTAPQIADIVADDIAFGAATGDVALTGAMFSGTTGTVQSSRTYIDDIYWESIPEPATMLLLGIGGLSLLIQRKK
jgi:hypothetical protein